jgi:hypothetical protein
MDMALPTKRAGGGQKLIQTLTNISKTNSAKADKDIQAMNIDDKEQTLMGTSGN